METKAKNADHISTIEYKPLMDGLHLCEIYSSGWECALGRVSGKLLEQSTVWVRCKDFLSDAVWAQVNKKTASIFGFQYPTKNAPPIDINKYVLFVRDSSISAANMTTGCQKALNVLKFFDKAFKFKPLSRLYLASRNDGGKPKSPEFVFIGDGKWLLAPPLLSLLGCLARLGRQYQPSHGNPLDFLKKAANGGVPNAGNDGGYLKPSISNGRLEKLLKQGPSSFDENIVNNYSIDNVSAQHCLGVQTWGYYTPTGKTLGKPYCFWTKSFSS